jgi:hypothetical protein
MISAKEKAIELVNRFYNKQTNVNQFGISQMQKDFALIVCNEVLGYMGADRGYAFWTEVKEEIEKL